jgi:hypothetical protein
MKRRLARSTIALLAVASPACFAEWPKQSYVEIRHAPQSELCASTSKVIQRERKDPNGSLFNKFRQLDISGDTEILGLTFYAQKRQQITTVGPKGDELSNLHQFYLLDIDNNGSRDMVMLYSGGLGAAGDGDVLEVLEGDPSSAPQPVPRQLFMDIALRIGAWHTTFVGKDDDPASYIYPFAFHGRNYLLLEGNRRKGRYIVAELVPGTGVVTHCYF